MLQQSKSTQAFNLQQENHDTRFKSELRSTATAVGALNSVTNKSFSHVYNDETSGGSYDDNNFAANAKDGTATTSRKNKIFDKKYLTKSYLANKRIMIRDLKVS